LKKLLNFRIIIMSVTLFIAGCSSLNTKDDYALSRESLNIWNIREAVEKFPSKEGRSFITVMERTYLNLLMGNPEIEELLKYARRMDNQIRYRVSREVKSLFYYETPEGYYASEHEIIWMHLLLSWGFSMKGMKEEARTEAVICGNFLGREYSARGIFDDPLMRVMLAAMWTMCGEWEEAQVDFRAAWRMNSSLKWAHDLSEMKNQPAELVLILGGTGQEPVWAPNLEANPLRGIRDIKFVPQGLKSRLSLRDSRGAGMMFNMTPDSSYWYKRHFIRDNEIQDLIQDSHYAGRAGGAVVKSGAIMAGGIAAGVAIASGGIALGAGIMYVGLLAESGEVVGFGCVPMIVGPMWGGRVINKAYDTSRSEFNQDMDVSRTYRFVRYLPEYAWVGWTGRRLVAPMTVSVSHPAKPLMNSKISVNYGSINSVIIGFYPDVYPPDESLLNRDGHGRSGE
jgi:hypothetical protein